MEILACLKKGLDIVHPFLSQHGFQFDKFVDSRDSTGAFTIAIYKNERKQFVIDYRFSIGQVFYRFDYSVVSHPFYMDHLGFANLRKHTGFLSADNTIAFNHILQDFEFLVDDFFLGDCTILNKISKLHDSIIAEVGDKVRKDGISNIDLIRIEKARYEFRNKDFKQSIQIYNSIANKSLLNDLDSKIIEFCGRHS